MASGGSKPDTIVLGDERGSYYTGTGFAPITGAKAFSSDRLFVVQKSSGLSWVKDYEVGIDDQPKKTPLIGFLEGETEFANPKSQIDRPIETFFQATANPVWGRISGS